MSNIKSENESKDKDGNKSENKIIKTVIFP